MYLIHIKQLSHIKAVPNTARRHIDSENANGENMNEHTNATEKRKCKIKLVRSDIPFGLFKFFHCNSYYLNINYVYSC